MAPPPGLRPGGGRASMASSHLGPTRRWHVTTTGQWRYVTDGGLETDLIFHHGVDLPEFAAYPLLRTDDGRALLRSYYEGYAAIAERAGAGLRLESPTWRAHPAWGAALGDDASSLDEANRAAIAFLQEIAGDWSDRVDGTRIV